MKKRLIIAILTTIALTSCNSGGIDSNNNPSGGLSVSITPNSFGTCSYFNAPCVSLSICDSSSNNCSTVPNILVDTGSYGLRVFSSVLNSNTLSSLTPELDNNNNKVAECVSYGDGSQNWGAVYLANIDFSNNNISKNVPIQIIDSSFATLPSMCSNATQSPSDFGLNGILGVGVYIADGGSYFSCNNTSCSPTTVSSSNQVSNPIAKMGANGITLVFPAVSNNGQKNVTGNLYFGVNTNNNNTFTNLNYYPAQLSSLGIPVFSSQYNNSNYLSFLDSGTNTLGISNSNLINCSSLNGFICENNTILAFNNLSNNGYINTNILIGNAETLLYSGNSAFNNIGSNLNISSNYMDFGMPFFYGKTIQLIFNGNSAGSSMNGPAWAW